MLPLIAICYMHSWSVTLSGWLRGIGCLFFHFLCVMDLLLVFFGRFNIASLTSKQLDDSNFAKLIDEFYLRTSLFSWNWKYIGILVKWALSKEWLKRCEVKKISMRYVGCYHGATSNKEMCHMSHLNEDKSNANRIWITRVIWVFVFWISNWFLFLWKEMELGNWWQPK